MSNEYAWNVCELIMMFQYKFSFFISKSIEIDDNKRSLSTVCDYGYLTKGFNNNNNICMMCYLFKKTPVVRISSRNERYSKHFQDLNLKLLTIRFTNEQFGLYFIVAKGTVFLVNWRCSFLDGNPYSNMIIYYYYFNRWRLYTYDDVINNMNSNIEWMSHRIG